MASFGSYNLLDYGRIPDPEREQGVRAVIEALDVDVLAVQEIYGRTRSEAAARLAELAESVGMTAYTETPAYDEDDVAIGFGNNDLHVGLMWRPERVSPVAGTCRSYHTLFWHALIKVTLEVPGGDGTSHAVQHASYHAGPFGQPLRIAEAERVVSALTRPNDRPPGIIGADWNCVPADRTTAGAYYDPDPYKATPWRPGYVYQCEWGRDPTTGELAWWRANRQPTEVLYAAGLLDAATALHNTSPGGVAWEPTAGHWPSDAFPLRRIDGIRVTSELAPALRSCTVAASPPAGAAERGPGVDPRAVSDHLGGPRRSRQLGRPGHQRPRPDRRLRGRPDDGSSPRPHVDRAAPGGMSPGLAVTRLSYLHTPGAGGYTLGAKGRVGWRGP